MAQLSSLTKKVGGNFRILQQKWSRKSLMLPFQQKPAMDYTGETRGDRKPAHELFCMFTADIIQRKTTFVR